MATTRIGRLFALGLMVSLMFGCASNKPEDTGDATASPGGETPAVDRQPVQPTLIPEVEKPPQPTIRGTKLWDLDPGRGSGSAASLVQLGGRFFFDFDQAIVKRAGHSELSRHAQYLAGNSSATLRLEGHADERGTREYNLALGERRAIAVRAYLSAQGATANQIEVISYGEEKPAGAGHDEASWAMNRRVELIYQ